MPSRLVTSYDVAKLAGVSQPTVSRTFAGSSNVSPATRARVLAAAKRLGYQPSAIARGLTTQQTDIVGVIMGNMSSSMFYPKVLDLLGHQLQPLGKQILFFNTSESRPIEDIMPRMMGYRVDGLIVVSTAPGRELVDMLTSKGTPVVLINRTIPNSSANSVCSNNESGGRLAAELFVQAGHHKPAFLAGVERTPTNTLREKGYKECLRESGHDNILTAQGAYSYESGYEAALHLLDRDDPPDAIFCAADIMALGAMDAARYRLGIRVPQDLSIVGYDDIPMAGWEAYNLTTIRQSVIVLVEAVMRLVVKPGDGTIITGENVLIPEQLIQRGSARLATA